MYSAVCHEELRKAEKINLGFCVTFFVNPLFGEGCLQLLEALFPG